jgi:Zn-dependent protease with chaperone function
MLDSLREFWTDLTEIREARMVVWLTLLAIVLSIGIFVVKWIRDMFLGINQASPTDHLTGFRALREQGKIDDEEYQRLRSTVSKKVAPQIEPEKVDFQEISDPVKPRSSEQSE